MMLTPDLNRYGLLLLISLLLSCNFTNVLAQSSTDTTDKTLSETEITDYGRTAYLHISGMIDRVRFRYLKRALENAAEENLATLIVHIDTDGGEVYYAREMLKLILDQPRAGRRTIAFVDFRAISAGAMIAYGHQALYISDTATIGDIGVIFVKPGGGIEYAPEKIETVIRALLAQAAEQNGWSRGALLKMTARNQNLYRIKRADGKTDYVIEDDLPEFLAEHPDIDKDDEKQVIVYRGKDRLLTLTGREALKLGMATELMPDLDSLYQHLGIERETVIDLRPSATEQLAAILARWAPLLSGLALLFILFELKTPGVGLWALLGLTFGALFLVSQYTLDMIDYLEVILIVLGLMLIATEFLTLVGGGLLGVAGAALVFIGLVMAFLPNELTFDLSDERFLDALSSASISGLIAIGIMALGIFTFIAAIPRSRLAKRLAVQAEVSATSVGQLEKSAVSLVGKRGVSRDSLRPGGVITIDGYDHNARVEYGAFIDAGQTVEVVAVEFGELIVRAMVDGDQLI